MPIIAGPITQMGAVIDVRIGVSRGEVRARKRNKLATPAPIFTRALIDTGANITAFSASIFRELGIQSVGTIEILTPSTPINSPYPVDLFVIELALVANGAVHRFNDVQAIAAEEWHPDEGANGLIGRDILAGCGFEYWGIENRFRLVF